MALESSLSTFRSSITDFCITQTIQKCKNKRPDICLKWFPTPIYTTPINFQKVLLTDCQYFYPVTVHTKRVTFHGTLAPHMLFHGKEWSVEPYWYLVSYFWMKWDVYLDPSWVLQDDLLDLLVGRAGRYGSKFPVGKVTCIDAEDLSLLHSSLESPSPTLEVILPSMKWLHASYAFDFS